MDSATTIMVPPTTTTTTTTSAPPRVAVASAESTPTCGLHFTWQKVLLVASQICWTFCLVMYFDIFSCTSITASLRLGFYLTLSGFILLIFAVAGIAQPSSSPDPPPPDDTDADNTSSTSLLVFKAIFINLSELLLLLFFYFALHLRNNLLTYWWLILAISYITTSGFYLINALEAHKSVYWLILCLLTALLCNPFTAFYPHHPRLLKLKLASTLLAVIIASLCGVVYVSHRRREARILQNPPVERNTQSQPTHYLAATIGDQTQAIDNIV